MPIASYSFIYTTLYLYCVLHMYIFMCANMSPYVTIGYNVYLYVFTCAFLQVPLTHWYPFGITINIHFIYVT